MEILRAHAAQSQTDDETRICAEYNKKNAIPRQRDDAQQTHPENPQQPHNIVDGSHIYTI